MWQGFLPEAADNFVVDYIYPSFSYQMGIFFTCSTVYGLWKVSAQFCSKTTFLYPANVIGIQIVCQYEAATLAYTFQLSISRLCKWNC